jgi:hypothetical protein
MRIRHIVICGLPRSTVFFHIFSNGTISEKKKVTDTKCVFLFFFVFFLQILCETFPILRRIQQDIKMCIGLYVSSRYSCPVLIKLIFFDRFSENHQISYCMKICSVGAELFHADGETYRRTDLTKLPVAFLNSANAPKMDNFLHLGSDVPEEEVPTLET